MKKNIKWESDNLDTYIFSKIYDVQHDLIKEAMEYSYGIELDKTNSLANTDLIYDNEMVKNDMFNSHVSVGAAIIASHRFRGGDFILPDEVLEYIMEEYEADRANQKNLPSKDADLKEGVKVYEMFKDLGYDDEAAYALAGACWVESRWNCHAVNIDEVNGLNSNTGAGWNNAGEGYFQLTWWESKYKVIRALQLPGIYGSPSGYEPGSAHISDLDENWWKKITEYFISSHTNPNHKKVLTGTDMVLQLCAAYLFKAAPGLEITFDNVKKRVTQTMAGHQKIYGSSYKPYNGFVYQMLAAYVLSKYASGKEIDLKDIGIDFTSNARGSGFISGIRKGLQNIGRVFGIDKQNVEPLSPGLFTKNPNGFNIRKACEWININSQRVSQHKCAKFVRMAIEAGGIKTTGRPNWAWKYINYLPSIGFKYIAKVSRADIGTNYKPEPGDIAVYQKGNNPDVPGHICMYTGKEWCSDFKQKNPIVYSSTKEAYIFRFV